MTTIRYDFPKWTSDCSQTEKRIIAEIQERGFTVTTKRKNDFEMISRIFPKDVVLEDCVKGKEIATLTSNAFDPSVPYVELDAGTSAQRPVFMHLFMEIANEHHGKLTPQTNRFTYR